MSIGIVGRKVGMTQVFTEDAGSVGVTVLQVEPNVIVQKKTDVSDGYSSVQVTTGSKKTKHLSKPEQGHFEKAGVAAGDGLWEFRGEYADHEVGSSLTLELFTGVSHVDVQATSKGKGFSGVIKRHGFKSQGASHGNSLAHRAPGSIGQNQTPGRVFKGKKMAGQLGNKKVTVQSLKVVRLDLEKGLILVAGSVPGPTGGAVVVKPAVKKSSNERSAA